MQEYAELFASFDDNVMFVDVNDDGSFSVASINPAAERSFGLNRHDVRGMRKRDLFPAELAARLESYDRACIDSGEAVHYEEVLGSRHYSVTHVPLKNEAGRISRIAAISRDITERKATEDALKESEARYQQVFEHSQEGLFLFDVTEDERFRMVEANPAFERLVGIPRAMMLGKGCDEILSASTAREIDKKFRRCLAVGTIFEEEILLDVASGRRTCVSTLVPVRDGNGKILRISGLMRDVTERRLYEQALLARAEQEQRLSSFVDSAPGFFFTLSKSADGGLSMPFASPGITHIIGLRPEDVVLGVEKLVARYHPDDVAGVQQKMAESGQNLSPCHAEFRVLNQDKGERWVEARSMPHRDESGNTFWHGFMQDVTERKLAQNRLEETRARLQTVLSTIPDMIWLKDADGVYLSCNPAFERFFGMREAEIVGNTDYDLVDAGLADFLRQKDRDAIEAGCVCLNEENIISADGGQMGVLETRKVPVYGRDGAVVGVLGVARDITERKAVESALQHSENLLKEAQRIAHVGSWDVDMVNDRLIWSDEIFRIWEIDKAQFQADFAAFLETVHPEDRECVLHAYNDAIRNRSRYEVEHRLLFPDGRVKYILERGEPQYDAYGRAVRFIGTSLEITERKRMQEALVASEREYRSLAENMPDNIARWGEEGRYLYVNPVHERTLGMPAASLIGKRIGDVFTDTHMEVKAAIAQVFATGQAALFVRQPVLVNGQMEIHDVNMIPERDARGKVVSVLGLGRNMTDLYRLQDDLAAREQQLRLLADSSPGMMGAFHARPDGSVCMPYVSPKIWELFGLHPQDVLDDAGALMALNHPEDAQRVNESIAESARSMTVWHEEYRIIHPIRGERWMESHTNPAPHPDGGVVWYGYVHDITERKAMEALLQKRESEFRSLAETSPDLIARFDRDCRRLYANRAMASLAGKTVDALVGEPPTDGVILAPAYAQKLMAGIGEVFATGTSVRIELSTVYRDGSTHEFDALLVPEFGANAKIETVLLLSRDITDRKRMEEALAASERKFRTLAENSPDPIYRYDRDCRRLYVNQAVVDIVGRPAEELIGTQPGDGASLVSDQSKTLTVAIREVFEGGAMQKIDLDFVDRNGEHHDYLMLLIPERDDADNVATVLGIARDVTDIRRAERKLRHFIANVPGCVYSFRKSPDGHFSFPFVSAGIEDIYGLTPEDVQDDMEPLHAMAHPDDVRVIEDTIAESVRNMTPTVQEYRVQRPGFPDKWIEARAIPERAADGGIVWHGIMFDVTERKRLETELNQSKIFLGGVLDGIFDPIFVKDRAHRWVLINDAFCALIGQPREALIGKSDYDFFPKEQADVFWEKDELVFESGQVNLNEESITAAGGQTHFIQTKKTSYISGDGSRMLVGVIRDITERRQAEQRLKQALEFSEGVINAIPDLLFEIDGDGRYLNVWAQNPVLLAAQKEILLGNYMHNVLSPDAAAVGMDALREAREHGVSLGRVMRIDLPRGASWFELSVSRKSTDNPLEPHYLVLSRDITERRQAEESLRESMEKITHLNLYLEENAIRLEENARDLEDQAVELEAQTVELEASQAQLKQTEAWYRSILHSAPDGMLVVDERGLIMQVNAQLETMFGYQDGELSGCPIGVLLPQECRDRHMRKFAEFSERQDGSRDAMLARTLSGRRKDGSTFPVDVSLSLLPAMDGQHRAVCASVRDITQRQAMEAARDAALAEALRLAQLRSAFMAQMSHELRTPLNGILGYTQNLLYSAGMGEKQLAGLRIIQHSGEHLLSVINGLLDHAAIEAGKFELILGDIELDPFLTAIIGIIRVRAEQKNISFSFDADENLPAVVCGDAQRLRQVLINLLANAVKFTDSGEVTLRVRQIAPFRIRFAVQDSGVGISPEQFENIFLPFEQTGETSRRAGGTGLGLAISRKLVRLMGGDISVESRLGAGSVFSFDIEMKSVISESATIDAAALSALAATSQATPSSFAPPAHELDILYQLALRGSMRDVMRHADHLLESDERYLDFVAQIRQLTKRFQTKALLALLEQYRKGN